MKNYTQNAAGKALVDLHVDVNGCRDLNPDKIHSIAFMEGVLPENSFEAPGY
jgi:hypothetical protein